MTDDENEKLGQPMEAQSQSTHSDLVAAGSMSSFLRLRQLSHAMPGFSDRRRIVIQLGAHRHADPALANAVKYCLRRATGGQPEPIGQKLTTSR
jgi:hypothetical protein